MVKQPCCRCGKSGTCSRCSCVQAGRHCVNCIRLPVRDICDDSIGHGEDQQLGSVNIDIHLGAVTDYDSLDQKMIAAFGAPMFRHNIYTELASDEWYQRWFTVISQHNLHYSLPQGSAAKKFLTMLTDEIYKVEKGKSRSERLIVFISLMLQWYSMIRKGFDIKRLLQRRLDMWNKTILMN